MARDDFSLSTARTLAKRVANKCSNPACRAVTSGPHTDSSKAVNLGVAAHITAASPEGARYDASLTTRQRKNAENGIWLCQNCGKLIDNDAEKYSVELVRNWKQQAEEIASAKIEKRSPANLIPLGDSIQITFDEWDIWQNRGNLPWDSVIVVSIWGRGDVIYSFKVRMRNMSPHEEQLHRLRMQLRRGDDILLEDALDFELALPVHRWITQEVEAGVRSVHHDIYNNSDSIWLAANFVGSNEEIVRKIADLAHATPLRIF